jgi:hypothetical protein
MEIMKSASCEAYLFQAWRSLRAQKVAKPAYNKVPPSVYPKGQQESWAMKEIAAIHSSWSYRIGRFITFFPRKIRGGIRCYREHGMKYTLNRVKEKIFAIFGR